MIKLHLLRKEKSLFGRIIQIGLLGLLLIMSPHVGEVRAEVGLRFIPNKEQVRDIVLENDHVKYTITINKTVMLSQALLKASGADLMAGNPPLTFSAVRIRQWGGGIDDVGFQLFTIDESLTKDRVSVSIRQQSSYVENSAIVSQTFTLGDSPELSWKSTVLNSATGGRSYREPRNRSSRVTFPLMQKLKLGSDIDTHYLIPVQVPQSKLHLYGQQGNFFCIDSPDDMVFYFTQPHDPKMPIDIYNNQNNKGIYFHVLETKFNWIFTDREDFISRAFQLRQGPGEESVIMDCRIAPHQGDWHAAFNAFKKYIRSNFDFTYYKRPVQEKYRQRMVSHFTFLYGNDIYDPQTNEFRIDRFLDEGEQNFGGYDYMLLWHDYPRMGMDDRDQFAMYEDLPGGLQGLKEMVNKAHARDVQVFLPYKPWDTMRKGQKHFKQEARISEAIGADGIFLDTMDKSDLAFREALDEVNPDNVFVSEGRPDLAAAQLVTGSWDKSTRYMRYPFSHIFPQVDLFRFIIPEHNVMHSDRANRDRKNLIYVSLFNGSGIIIWEDVFGEMNLYSAQEKTFIHRYNRIIHENSDAYLTDNPLPLVADLREDLFVNAFPIENKCVYPAYQIERENVDRRIDNRLIGPFMPVEHPQDWHFVDVWNHQEIPTDKKNDKTRLIFPEEPTGPMSCIVGMPKNLKVTMEGNNIKITPNNTYDDAIIQINTVNNLTLMEEEVLKIPGDGGDIDVKKLDLKFPYKVLIKLMQGDILKDEVILNLGWKKI